ncbi:MAG: GGDEF domain-containing protein [Eubacteriales bacterium]|nr:GGDEF domain-containing protein [Eubacteriales bacterium]
MNHQKPSVKDQDLHANYGAYRLRNAQNYIHILVIITSVLNLLFIICDINFIEEQTPRLLTAIIRYSYSVLLIVIGGVLSRTKSYRCYTILISALEAIGVAISFYVIVQYDSPNFMIQSMGLMALLLIIFLVPNRKSCQIPLAVVTLLGFYILTYTRIPGISLNELAASVSYSLVVSTICAISSFHSEKNQLKEFITKTRLEQISTTDFLTNTANRFRLEEEADRWMNFCRRQKLPLCLVFVDVDNLKQINDAYGHSAGDGVLITLAGVMQAQLRNSDTIARWGGDEFVLLLPNVSLNNAVNLLERLKTVVTETKFFEGISVTCSYGVVEMKEGSSFQTLLAEADALMYSGKKDGKDKISFSDQNPE